MKDGEVDFSRYTHEQVARGLSSIDRQKYPLNYANLLATQRALPALPMDDDSIVARKNAGLLASLARETVTISAPALLTFWLPCLSRVAVHGENLEVRNFLQRREVPLAAVTRIRWFDTQPNDEWHLAVIESRNASPIKFLPRSRELIRACAAHINALQGGIDIADPNYQSIFSIGWGD